jgi:hypothetical protein
VQGERGYLNTRKNKIKILNIKKIKNLSKGTTTLRRNCGVSCSEFALENFSDTFTDSKVSMVTYHLFGGKKKDKGNTEV